VNDGLCAVARDILARAKGERRYVFAIAGAPGSGKSTLAGQLHAALEAEAPGASVVMPMDGFHLDNAVLDARGLRSRKGAPETFDVEGLRIALERIRLAEAPVAIPVFDRALDLARAGARIVSPDQPVVLLEGNYLLLDDAPWSGLPPLFDRTLFVAVAEDELARRLIARWRGYGLGAEAARARAEGNDLPNARLVLARSRPAAIRWVA
jgi:pantothenate kinase